SHRYRPSTLDQPVLSRMGAVLVLLPVRFPVSLAGPCVRSTHLALHGFAREVWLRPEVGIVPRTWRGTTLRKTMTLFTKQLQAVRGVPPACLHCQPRIADRPAIWGSFS